MPDRSLRQLIAAPEILVMPGVYDGFSAKLVERAGYDGGFLTGSGISESRIGRPDVGLTGLAESVGAARDIAACVDLHLIADADTGYGNAVNVFYGVQAFERTGVSGVMIEDQQAPKRCGHLSGKELISTEEMAGKIAAAADARTDEDFVVMARTDAAASMGVEGAIERGLAYAEAGADLLFADALLSVEDIAAFVAGVDAPVAVNMGFAIRARRTTPLLSAHELEALGVAVMIAPRMLTAAAIRGMQQALDALAGSLRTGEAVERDDLLVSFEELHDLMGLDDIHALERRFLAAEQLGAKYGERKPQ